MQISDTDQNFKIWDKAQVIVACSRTRIGGNTIFVGDKTSTINTLTSLIQQRNQWTDYMEMVLNLVTINGTSENNQVIFNQERSFPFRICDISLPQCNTGFVYFLISLRDPTFSYIGMTDSITRRIKEHNSGTGAIETAEPRLRPFAVFAYICGFEKQKNLMRQVESEWKDKVKWLQGQGITCKQQYVFGSEAVILSKSSRYNNDLRLVTLFKHISDE